MEDKQEMGLLNRLTGIITNPRVTLEAVIEKPTILGPAMVYSLVSLVLFLITLPKLEKYSVGLLEKMQGQMSPEQLAQAKSIMPISVAVGGIVSAILVPLLLWLAVSLMFKFFNLFIGNEAPLKKLFAVAVITSMPRLFGSLLRSVMTTFSSPENVASVSTSAALVLPKGQIGPLFAVLSQIDPFMIWSLVLLAIGAAMVLKTSAKKAGVFVFVLWVLMVVALAAVSALSPTPVAAG